VSNYTEANFLSSVGKKTDLFVRFSTVGGKKGAGMPKIFTDKLEPGMKLTKPVTRGNTVLLNKDTELTERLIIKIRNMNIKSVYIDVPSQHSIPKEEMLVQMNMRFKNVENKPYMNLLKRLVREHIEVLYEQ